MIGRASERGPSRPARTLKHGISIVARRAGDLGPALVCRRQEASSRTTSSRLRGARATHPTRSRAARVGRAWSTCDPVSAVSEPSPSTHMAAGALTDQTRASRPSSAATLLSRFAALRLEASERAGNAGGPATLERAPTTSRPRCSIARGRPSGCPRVPSGRSRPCPRDARDRARCRPPRP